MYHIGICCGVFVFVFLDFRLGLRPAGEERCGKKQQNKNTARIVGIAVIFLILLILNAPGLLFFLKPEQKEAIAPTSGKHNKNQTRNSARLSKTYTLKKGWEGKARKKAEITCPAWGVRGHYRHYRNGKTVFVEAYVKGREKEAYKGKEYNLLPYKDA